MRLGIIEYIDAAHFLRATRDADACTATRIAWNSSSRADPTAG